MQSYTQVYNRKMHPKHAYQEISHSKLEKYTLLIELVEEIFYWIVRVKYQIN